MKCLKKLFCYLLMDCILLFSSVGYGQSADSVVVDFSKMTDEEIELYLKDHSQKEINDLVKTSTKEKASMGISGVLVGFFGGFIIVLGMQSIFLENDKDDDCNEAGCGLGEAYKVFLNACAGGLIMSVVTPRLLLKSGESEKGRNAVRKVQERRIMAYQSYQSYLNNKYPLTEYELELIQSLCTEK